MPSRISYKWSHVAQWSVPSSTSSSSFSTVSSNSPLHMGHARMSIRSRFTLPSYSSGS